MQAVKLLIQGKVQGVGYRRWFEQQAIKLELNGYVKNLTTGEVEALVIGTEEAIHKIIKHSLVGPLRANVTKIDQHVIPMHELDYSDFKMIR